MPLIYCPSCSRITYAYPIYDETNAIAAYRCSNCYNVFNYDQVHEIPFPNNTVILNTTFARIVSEIDRIDYDELLEKKTTEQIAEDFVYILKYLCRPDEINVANWRFVQWDYRNTREADEQNEELFENVQREFAELVDKEYYVPEIRESDEGDSVFLAMSPNDVDKVVKCLKKYNYLLS